MSDSDRIVRLRAGRAQAFDPLPGDVLRVLRGRLWVTQTGHAEDHFVAAGQSLALGRGRVVVEADLGVTAVYRCDRAEAARRARYPRLAPASLIPKPTNRPPTPPVASADVRLRLRNASASR